MTIPVSHLDESLKLEADKPISLWQISLVASPTILRFRDGADVMWQGNLWEGIGCQLTGESESADDERSRPQLVIHNPDNIFGPFAEAGFLDLAVVVRRMVLQKHLRENVNIAQMRTWLIGKPSGVSDQKIQLELRDLTDMPAWKTPARSFMPPEYPFVVY